MNLIALIDINNGIARNGEQITFVKSDLKRFRLLTWGGTVIMGRKTYESLPRRKPLTYRTNVIVSRTMTTAPKGFVLMNDIQEVIGRYMHDASAWVIGGSEIYGLLMPYCQYLYLTQVQKDYHADKFLYTNITDSLKLQLVPELSTKEGVFYVDPESQDRYVYRTYKNLRSEFEAN